VLGIFIGVLLVVTVASVLNGFRQSVVDQVEQFGTNNIYVYRMPFMQLGPMSPSREMRRAAEARGRVGDPRPLPVGRDRLAGIQVPMFLKRAIAAASKWTRRGCAACSRTTSRSATACSPRAASSPNRRTSTARRWWCSARRRRRRCSRAAGAVGKQILVDGRGYTVVGTLEKRKDSPLGGQNEEDTLFLAPYYTMRRFYPGPRTTTSSRCAARAASCRRPSRRSPTVLRKQRRCAGTRTTTSRSTPPTR
jgi:hypothetical protein